jgi:hypothetical protein
VSPVSLVAMLASTAGAATWTNTSDTSFTATGGNVTLAVGANNLTCGSATATGNAPMSVAASPATAVLATGTILFQGCVLVDVVNAMHCVYALTGVSYGAPTVTADADVTCSLSQGGRAICHLEGRTAANHTSNAGDSTLVDHAGGD